MWQWLLYHTGGTWKGPVPSAWYNEPSGFVSCLGLFANAIAITFHAIASYRHKNCHVHRCPRIGRYPVEGTPYVVCVRHAPGSPPTHAEVIAAHHAAKLTRSPKRLARTQETGTTGKENPGGT